MNAATWTWTTGLRRGELLGLKWEDLDLDRGDLRVRRQIARINGEVVEDDFLFGAICNSTSVGGILTLDPKQVDMADGKLEVLLVRSPQSLLELTECIAAVQSQQYNNCEMITFRSGSKIEITADPEMPWTLDGEREDGHEHITVVNKHLAYRLVQKPRESADA